MRFQISTRIILGQVGVGIMLLVVCWYTWFSTDFLSGIIVRVLTEEVPALEAVDRLQDELETLRVAEAHVLMRPEDADARRELHLRVLQLEELTKGLQPLRSVGESETVVAGLISQLNTLARREANLAARRDPVPDGAELRELREAAFRNCAVLESAYRTYIRSSALQHLTVSTTLRTTAVWAAVIAIMVVVLVTTGVFRMVLDPLRRLVRVTERIAEGDMLSVAQESLDEFGRLGRSFNQMVTALKARLDELVVANARLHEAQSALERELRLAQRIQHSILPADTTVPGYSLFTQLHAARSVGGDFYDVQPLDAQSAGLVLGDVSGRGIPAALVMVLSLVALRDGWRLSRNPARVLEHANSVIRKHFTTDEIGSFVTVCALRMESGGRVECSLAGHEPPLLVRSESGQVAEVECTPGLFLGPFESLSSQLSVVEMQPGDKLVLFTDGITEARNLDQEFFGRERIIEVMAEGRARSAHELGKRILDRLAEFQQWTPPDDDVSLIVIERV